MLENTKQSDVLHERDSSDRGHHTVISGLARSSDVTQFVRNFLADIATVKESNGMLRAIAFFFMTLFRSRRPISVRIGSTAVTLRPSTPDIAVARISLSGELDLAIEAASPLRHGFIIDGGGYIGTAAMELAKAFPGATIVTLEPSAANFAILRTNCAAYPNIVAINKALGPAEGTLPLVDRRTGESGFSIVPRPADCRSPRTLHSVSVTTIDALMKEFGADGIDLLKLDIEGAEYELLKNPAGWLDATRVVAIELHDRIVPGCQSVFDRATAGRITILADGEKIISISRQAAGAGDKGGDGSPLQAGPRLAALAADLAR